MKTLNILIVNILIIFMGLFAVNTAHAQPTQVKDIDTYCCSGGSIPSQLFVHNGSIYFSAEDHSGANTPGGVALGREIWISDGTSNGTQFLKDINTGDPSGGANTFFVYNNTLYFTANDGTGYELFTTDGTETGTVPVTGIGEVDSPVLLNGLVYHINREDKRLYQFNGTVSEPVVGSGEEYIQGGQLIVLNNKIFCYMNTSSGAGVVGTELYAYDPTMQSFELIKDINGNQIESEIYNMTLLGTEIYFSVFAESELWKTDGTTIGTVQVTAISDFYSLASFYAWNGKLFFEGDDENGIGDQLWMYDPALDTVSNLSLLPNGSNHDPSDYIELDGWLYYSGEDSNDNESHLWRTQGSFISGEATFQLDDTITDVRYIAVLNGKLYFRGNNGTDGNELFEFDPATLSINSFSINRIKTYPNPVSETLYISTTEEINNIFLYDMLGNQMQIENLKNQIDVSTYQSGIYLLKVESNNGDITKKIVIE